MSWNCLGWLESKPAVMKFWTIRNKGTATHFMANGAQWVNQSFHATEIIFIMWRRLYGHSSNNFYLSLLLNSNLRAILCRIWSFKGLASSDLPFVHSAITFCVSRKLQYYRAENRAMAKVLRAKFIISRCMFANFKGILAFPVLLS